MGDQTGRRKASKSLRLFRNNDNTNQLVNTTTDSLSNAIFLPHEESIDNENDSTLTPDFPLAVELQPFKNKVGGHTAIFKFSHRAVCKELINRENKWYESIEIYHPELLAFMPKYIGVLNVRYNPNANANETKMEKKIDEFPEVNLIDNPHMIPSSISNINNEKIDVGSTKVNIKLKDLILSEVFSREPESLQPKRRRSSFGQESFKFNIPRRHSYSTNSAPLSKTEIMQCLQEEEEDGDSLEEDEEEDEEDDDLSIDTNNNHYSQQQIVQQPVHEEFKIQRFLLLEDLTSGMNHPSVLDMKMGTRQYGIEANLKKRNSQRVKCANTTSRLLGTRVCGMQVWDKSLNKFINRDKYFGRKLKIGESFVQSLARFLYDGLTIYSIVKKIEPLLENLNELIVNISQLKKYRLYGSSILIMYDDNDDDKLIVRLIDFAQCVIGDIPLSKERTTFPPNHSENCDDGYLRGLNSLKFYLLLMFKEFTNGVDFEERDKITINELMIKCPWLDSFEGNDGIVENIPCPYNFKLMPTFHDNGDVSE